MLMVVVKTLLQSTYFLCLVDMMHYLFDIFLGNILLRYALL